MRLTGREGSNPALSALEVMKWPEVASRSACRAPGLLCRCGFAIESGSGIGRSRRSVGSVGDSRPRESVISFG